MQHIFVYNGLPWRLPPHQLTFLESSRRAHVKLARNASTYRFRDICGQMAFRGPKNRPPLPILVLHLPTPKDIATKGERPVRMRDLPSGKLSRRSAAPLPRYLS